MISFKKLIDEAINQDYDHCYYMFSSDYVVTNTSLFSVMPRRTRALLIRDKGGCFLYSKGFHLIVEKIEGLFQQGVLG